MRGAAAGEPTDSRLVMLAEADHWSPSTRYRLLQHVPRLREFFPDIELSFPRDPNGRRDGRVAQAQYFAKHGARYAERAVRLSRLVGDADALFVQRGLYVLGPDTIVSSLRGLRGPLVYDLDDAVFTPGPALARKGPAARWLYGGRQSLALLRRADAIVVSTKLLAEMLPDGIATVTVMATVPDVAAHRVVTHTDEHPARVGWTGTVGGVCFLDPLADVFARLRDQQVATLEVVSSLPWDGPATFRKWRLVEETSLFERFDIGIMPLLRSDYTKAKAGFKLLQYMASGLPVIGSPIGLNVELIERSGAGFLADTPSEWEEALRTLAGDPDLRRELGARGRAFVERYGDLDLQARTLAGLLRGE